ncbi:MAG TPA: peroxidase-related enzyme [Aliidongia sp.]|uniref:peroxidase-related enzyme n=1 Tax=Aliidongia sp. TaxID=1914230 RepID=UPI002DDD10FD|nr:peroxidase-related enzyme [Aliidongia sp.]HEV2673647.1 peroxidase-related enzyme [Aliidongia sp.]
MNDVVHDFTADPLAWRPYLTPVVLDDATLAQRAALQETPSNTKISDYVLVLAHDPESLGQRTPLFNGIMYGRGGLSRAERELGATAASVVNRCIYCVSVHAGRYIGLAKQPDVIAAVFDGTETALGARDQAIVGYATRLALNPPQATGDDVRALRAAGLSELEILDLTLSVAVFGWANRLMHPLGEAIRPREA